MAGDFRKSPASTGYQADYALAPSAVAPGQVLTTKTRFFAGAKEKEWLDRYEAAGIPDADAGDRLGLVPLVHDPDLRPAADPVPRARQFRVRDHCPDFHRPRRHVPDRAQAVPVDGGDAQAPAQDEGGAGALQGRQGAPAAGNPEAVPGREDQPGRGLPPDPAPDPGLLRALQNAAGVGGNAPPAVHRLDQGFVGAPIRSARSTCSACSTSRCRTSSQSASCRSWSARPSGRR